MSRCRSRFFGRQSVRVALGEDAHFLNDLYITQGAKHVEAIARDMGEDQLSPLGAVAA